MERRVLISYAADDPDWTPEQVEAVASAIEQTGIRVHLDRWHQRDRKRRLSLAEWQAWMDASIDGATHILCLVSTRYRALWARDPAVPGGYGVAFESIRLIHHLYLLKQHNDGRILTLRPDGQGFDCIPRDLALDCPEYCWAVHRDILLSHLGEAELPGQVGVSAPASSPSTAPRNPAPRTSARPAPPPAPKPGPNWASASGKDDYGHWADLTVNDVTQRMRWIPPTGPEGFWMGSPAAERMAIKHKNVRVFADKYEHDPRRVQVPAGFWLADTPCTQAFWRAVADIDPSHFSKGAEASERPVESVSWDTVMEQFIARMVAMHPLGLEGRLCLPSDVEWEYACRAGTRTAYWWGDTWDESQGNVDVMGKRDWNDAEGTTPVKRYGPNPWGLYDMHGNVCEWCADVWRERLDAPEARPDKASRVTRGGSWFLLPGHARAAYRSNATSGLATRGLGFRFALRSPVGPEAR